MIRRVEMPVQIRLREALLPAQLEIVSLTTVECGSHAAL
jgi:hypothetical protein